MKSLLFGLLALLVATAAQACGQGYPCGGHDEIVHHRLVIGHGEKVITYPIFGDRTEHVFVPNECNQCGGIPAPVHELVANAVIGEPCPEGGWFLQTPIYGVTVVHEDGCGGRLYPGRRIHINRRGDWNSVEGGGHC